MELNPQHQNQQPLPCQANILATPTHKADGEEAVDDADVLQLAHVEGMSGAGTADEHLERLARRPPHGHVTALPHAPRQHQVRDDRHVPD